MKKSKSKDGSGGDNEQDDSGEEDHTEVRSDVSDMETHSEIKDEGEEDQPPPLPTSPLPKEPPSESLPSLPPTERLLGGPVGQGASAASTFVTTRYEEKVEGEDDIPPLPVELEQNIKVLKDSDQLGVQVDIEEGGINGLVVRSVNERGTVGRDSRIQVRILPKAYMNYTRGVVEGG